MGAMGVGSLFRFRHFYHTHAPLAWRDISPRQPGRHGRPSQVPADEPRRQSAPLKESCLFDRANATRRAIILLPFSPCVLSADESHFCLVLPRFAHCGRAPPDSLQPFRQKQPYRKFNDVRDRARLKIAT